MNLDSAEIKSIKGDASFRKFYRAKIKKKSFIIVLAKKEKRKNLLNYDSINKILLKNKINVPKLVSENFDKNYMVIQDLGNKTVFDIFKKKKLNKVRIYKKILNILIKIQDIKLRKIKNFKNNTYKIPVYSKKKIFDEANLFLKWYAPQFIKKNKLLSLRRELKKNIIYLINKIKLSNNTFVHRDFHVSNLMIKKNKIFIIDSQDAVYGNIAYDLASLIDDVRLKTSENIKEKIYQIYCDLRLKSINKENFKNDFEILSILRNLKVIGVFTRLAIRDNKKKYLKLIPYAWKLIEYRMNNNKIFFNLKKILEKNFSKKVRLKK